ncbi:SURF1 family protein [Glaciecola sp. XM2]|jgi:cytochrome oxidase assembly protein ShyY1|uniref:SURF1 family protein n=1 Tax=Glaciecola sp. XM2 TaxID=1914931 RepID=UPI001BDDE417|nr:SURF1 family protein [Glaciecola sp. XM2]MBT1451448.1 SURF1 family protein [Glaciecola sp. XM2]
MLFRNTNRLTILVTLVALCCIVIMFFLGFWQLDRKQQKEARLAQIESRQDANPLYLSDVVNDPDAFVDFPLQITGELRDELFYIDNRLKNGVAGYEVLVPVITDYDMVMVNLGWVPGTGSRDELPRVLLPFTQQHLGRIYVPQDNTLINETNFNYGRFPVLMQQIDFTEIEQHLGRDVLPFTLRLDPSPDANFVRDWQVVVMAPERHLGYAIQWFGLGIAGLTVFLLTAIKTMQGRQD